MFPRTCITRSPCWRKKLTSGAGPEPEEAPGDVVPPLALSVTSPARVCSLKAAEGDSPARVCSLKAAEGDSPAPRLHRSEGLTDTLWVSLGWGLGVSTEDRPP